MLMELVYRLAVEETPFVRRIRDGVITLITPVVEVDGRDRMVDVVQLERALKVGRGGVPLVYWGKYVAHDNNRDGLVAQLRLTQNINAGFQAWRPTVLHDLHESVPFLYTSTGTGPYNEQLDPIVVGEWHQLAYEEINELTKRGLPACGRTASTTAGRPTTCSASRSTATRSGGSTRRTRRWAPTATR
jgi:hypothetical protein